VGPAGPRDWTQKGLDLADREPDAAYWRGPLLNNVGWHLHEAGQHEDAVIAFEQALRAREEDPGNAKAIAFARDALAAAREAAGR
jgi:Tfp pilus assembly protein PilF